MILNTLWQSRAAVEGNIRKMFPILDSPVVVEPFSSQYYVTSIITKTIFILVRARNFGRENVGKISHGFLWKMFKTICEFLSSNKVMCFSSFPFANAFQKYFISRALHFGIFFLVSIKKERKNEISNCEGRAT